MEKTSSDYFLASKSLPWWAIGASLIAANISAEQIVGTSGSGYAIGLAISSYEWMAALTLLIVGKFFLPIFLKKLNFHHAAVSRTTLRNARSNTDGGVLVGLYVFVNLTSIVWLRSIAVERVTGVSQEAALVLLGSFALLYGRQEHPRSAEGRYVRGLFEAVDSGHHRIAWYSGGAARLRARCWGFAIDCPLCGLVVIAVSCKFKGCAA